MIRSLMPYLIFPGTCREAMVHYEYALGASVRFAQTFGESPLPGDESTRDRIFNAELALGAAGFRMSDDDPKRPSLGGNRMSMFVVFSSETAKRTAFSRLAEEGRVLFPIRENFGMVVDRFGVQWMVSHEAAEGESA